MKEKNVVDWMLAAFIVSPFQMSTNYSSCVAYFMSHGSFSDYMSCLLLCGFPTFAFLSLSVLSISCFYALSAFFVFPTRASVMLETLKIKDVSEPWSKTQNGSLSGSKALCGLASSGCIEDPASGYLYAVVTLAKAFDVPPIPPLPFASPCVPAYLNCCTWPLCLGFSAATEQTWSGSGARN